MNQYLAHYGIPGQKWGIRRYQNEDGSLTPEGQARYLDKHGRITAEGYKLYQADLAKREQRLKSAKETTQYAATLGAAALGLAATSKADKNLESLARLGTAMSPEQRKQYADVQAKKARTLKAIDATAVVANGLSSAAALSGIDTEIAKRGEDFWSNFNEYGYYIKRRN